MNARDPMDDTTLIDRLNTYFIMKNCTIEMEKDWVTSTASAPYYFSGVQIKQIGTAIIEGNTFINASTGQLNGHGTMTIREYNDVVKIIDNDIVITDEFFDAPQMRYSSAEVNSVEMKDNRTSTQYTVDKIINLYVKTTIMLKNFLSHSNSISTKSNYILSTTSNTLYDKISLPTTSRCKFKFKVSVATAGTVHIRLANNDWSLLTTVVNSTLEIGTYIYYVEFDTPYSATNVIDDFRIAGESDPTNSFSFDVFDV